MTFCPNCGADNEPRAKFCTGCGRKIERDPIPAPVIVKKEFPFQPQPLFIIAGIVLITALYFLPLHTLVYPDGSHPTMTIAAAASLCYNRSNICDPLLGIELYAGWIIGISLIIYGIFQKRPTE